MRPTKQSAPTHFLLPCVVNVRDLDPDQLDELIEAMTEKLGGKFFRDKDLFMAVLNDRTKAAQEPRSFLYGPYIMLTRVPSGDLRITTCDGMVGGEACYAIDQFQKLVDSGLAGTQLGYESPSSLDLSPSR